MNMKALLVVLLVALTPASFAADFFLVAKPGILISKKSITQLYCPGITVEPCAFELSLADGVYLYISESRLDSVTLVVNSDGVHILGDQTGPVRIVQ